MSWSLFGLLAVMCGGLLASLHALIARMDNLATDLRGDMRALRTELTGRMDGGDSRMDRFEGRMDRLDSRMDALTAEIHLYHADVERRSSDGGL